MSHESDEFEHDEVIEAELVESRATPQQTYDAVSDPVVGFNLRLSDNVFQAIAILACSALGALSSALALDSVFEDRIPAAVIGGFIGMLVGLFGSGIGLMVYRAFRH